MGIVEALENTASSADAQAGAVDDTDRSIEDVHTDRGIDRLFSC
jgi:hypothetical protein